MMFAIPAPHGGRIDIPTLPDDESIVYPTMADPAAVRRYYEQEGYVVLRGLVDHAACDQMRAVFDEEIKPFDGYIYRQATAKCTRSTATCSIRS
jgi:phytanoyl-CoA hydroxylase